MKHENILKLLQKLHRMRHKPDLHSFKAKIEGGLVYVEAQWDGFYVEFFTYDAEGNETREHWTGSTAATARELERLSRSLGEFIRVMAEFAAAALPGLTRAAKVQAALKEAPPRVRHLAEHGKKCRTRKKNINRALREYQRRTRKRDRT